MKRRLFNILSALSLVVCVATMVLWILSIWVILVGVMRIGGYGKGREPFFTFVYSSRGCVKVIGTTDTMVLWPLTGFYKLSAATTFDNGFRWAYLGFDGNVQHLTNATPLLQFVIPDWFICSVTAVLPYRWYRSYRRRLAERKGLCPRCGYDLRASKERCPECGTPITPTEAKA